MRIISLLPSATEIVCLLGLEDQLVGVSADSDSPMEVVWQRPVSIDTAQLTSREIDEAASQGHHGASLYHVDPDLLRNLRPDVILTQEIYEECAVSRRDVELATRTLGYTPRVLSLSPVTLDQVLEDIELVARVADVPDRSRDVIHGLRARLDSVRSRTGGLPHPPEMVDLAGEGDELGTPAGPSRRVRWEDVVAYSPEVIILMPCSLELERVAAEFELLRERPYWDRLPAARSGRVHADDTHLFSRSGPRLVDGVETLARVLHPERFTEPIGARQALKVSADGQRLERYQ